MREDSSWGHGGREGPQEHEAPQVGHQDKKAGEWARPPLEEEGTRVGLTRRRPPARLKWPDCLPLSPGVAEKIPQAGAGAVGEKGPVFPARTYGGTVNNHPASSPVCAFWESERVKNAFINLLFYVAYVKAERMSCF